MKSFMVSEESLMMSVLIGLKYVVGVVLIGFLMCLISVVVCQRSRFSKDQKISFECGFDPLSSARVPFSLPFFLVALLFLLFDVEVILLLGLCFSLKVVSFKMCYLSMLMCVLFCVILLMGLGHEMNEGSLDWRH
uniref:NADH-ubiquinone oxidoreductase chain 3 n=1 Tax=Raeta sp. TaxID=3067663 RepID=A0AA49X7Q2_9BIVA|nr:NADH dehydrogenase subunit 3 [Raeta sp.]